jgi:hypothetical protein
VDAVAPAAAILIDRQEVPREILLQAHRGDELRRLAVEEIHPRIAPLEQPLAEIAEAGDAAAGVADEHLPGIAGRRVLATGALAAQAEDPARLEHRAVLEERRDRGLHGLLGLAGGLLELPLAQGRGNGEVEVHGLAPAGEEMAQRVPVDPLAHLVGEELQDVVHAVGVVGHRGNASQASGYKRRPWVGYSGEAEISFPHD